MKQGILICGHGSRDKDGITHFQTLVEKMRQRYPDRVVDYGFLEFAHPVYAAAVERMYQQGVRHIIALPAILFAGGHAKNDIPYEMNTLQQQYPDLKITMAGHLGITAPLLQLAQLMVQEAATQTTAFAREESCLLLVGRGTSDPDANSDVAKLTRMLWEGMGFGFATTAYIGVTKPLLADVLPLLEKLPFKKIIVLPVFLFTGILLKRIYEQVAEFQLHADKEYICTTPFGSHEWLLQAIDERIREAEAGNPNMNCQLCKYRTQIIGFEEEQGKEQVGHHLNVKGILFEEEVKPGEKKGIMTTVKKVFGI
ncbi:sirohydrochlorin cobaltochelatase [Chitinophaga niastensis]|uniref:Sirohydrochlorin cobaltochelatase n=1 Tax=Chitinophaga niastensis TaxID=536980 RepID=A0A2P8HGY9_CHINA|nr:sirohydrochlorin chelatase [Chitinophaga niastensis]PSL45479.1 sirohydrochlorin cobaltochelatase [Chitinophaga niastensis]